MAWRWRWPWVQWPTAPGGPAINGDAAAAKAAAQEQLDDARSNARRADDVADRARDLARRSNHFAREVERAFHLRWR
jgi:hypothetical protein